MIFVSGAAGYIGRWLVPRLQTISPVISLSRSNLGQTVPFDLSKPDDFDYGRIKPGDMVIGLAAVSSPDVCSRDYEYAYSINVTGTKHFIDRALVRGARVIFCSSDTVFGATKTPVYEEAPCQPVGDYGEMKRTVEKSFSGHSAFKALRLSYVLSRHDKFTTYLSNCAATGQEADIFHPMSRRVVYLGDLIDAVVRLCSDWGCVPGTFLNVAGPELVSRLDLAKIFSKSVDPRLRYRLIEPEPSFFEARPRVIDMRSRYFADILGHAPRTVSEAYEIEFGLDRT